MIKSSPLVIPKALAKTILEFGKTENIITKIQIIVQIKKEDKEIFPLLNLKKNRIIAIIDSIGNIIEYINIITP
jgi:hypothetical protein